LYEEPFVVVCKRIGETTEELELTALPPAQFFHPDKTACQKLPECFKLSGKMKTRSAS
jgi:hypothetical protein